MKKLLTIITILFLVSCTEEIVSPDIQVIDVPQSLQINKLVGIKTESIIVQNEVRMNVKLDYPGEFRIKLRDIEGELVSQEKVNGIEGNNLFKVYVSTLPSSSYSLQLTDINHNVLGVETIVVTN